LAQKYWRKRHGENLHMVSISSTFTGVFFCTKVIFSAFLKLLFVFVTFWQKDVGAQAAHKMLMKLIKGRPKNFNNVCWK